MFQLPLIRTASLYTTPISASTLTTTQMTSTSQNQTAGGLGAANMYQRTLTPLPGIGQTTTTVTSDAPLTTTVTTYPAATTTTGYLFATGGLFMPGFILEPAAFLNAQTVCATDLQVQSATQSQLAKSHSKSCDDLTSEKKTSFCQEEMDAYINDKVAERVKEIKAKMEEREVKELIETQKVEIAEKVEKIEEKLRSRSSESHGGSRSRSREHSALSTSRAVCNKCHDVLVKELSLDEKIKRIREELNLPPERADARCADSMHSRHYHDFHFGNTRCHHQHECDDIVERTATTKYKTNCVRPRSSRSLQRSKSALEVSRSKSRSVSAKSSTANRPAWRCTNTNDYTHTMVSRADLLAKQYAKDYIAAEKCRTNSAATQTHNDRHKSCQTSLGEPTTYYKTHYEPVLVGWNESAVSRPKQPQYYKTCTSYYKTTEHLPNINTTATQHCTSKYEARPSTSLGYDYNYNNSSNYYSRAATPKYVQETVKYPSLASTATKYICYPAAVERTVARPSTKQHQHASTAFYVSSQTPQPCTKSSTVNLKPIETTKGGAIYRNPSKANEIHYVSDHARNAWYAGSQKNGIVKIHNAGTTIIHD